MKIILVWRSGGGGILLDAQRRIYTADTYNDFYRTIGADNRFVLIALSLASLPSADYFEHVLKNGPSAQKSARFSAMFPISIQLNVR